MKYFKFAGLVLLLLGCTRDPLQVSVSEKQRLLQRIDEYYSFEKSNDWAKAYEYRSSDFRSFVDKEKYVRLMSALNDGWQLENFELKGGVGDESRYIYSATFAENISQSYAEQRGLLEGQVTYFTENIIWQKEQGEWYCVSCGIRYRLELNRELRGKE